jgi:hypothetical protein
MTREELFNVLMKAMGVMEIVTGIQYAPNLLGQYWQWKDHWEFFSLVVGTMLSALGIHLVTGCALLFGSDWLTRKIFPASSELADEEPV